MHKSYKYTPNHWGSGGLPPDVGHTNLNKTAVYTLTVPVISTSPVIYYRATVNAQNALQEFYSSLNKYCYSILSNSQMK